MTVVNLKNSAPIEVFGDIGGGGESSVFVVHKAPLEEGDDPLVIRLDKTFREIAQAANDGKLVVFSIGEMSDDGEVELMYGQNMYLMGFGYSSDSQHPQSPYLTFVSYDGMLGSNTFNCDGPDDYPYSG